MMSKFKFDQNLREVPVDPQALKNEAQELRNRLGIITGKKELVQTLGKIGTYLRCLGELDVAEKTLLEALKIISENRLGFAVEIQQKIRLAHIIQWKKDFIKSDALFSEILQTCRTNPEATDYLDFALQHAGKNFFDQHRFPEALQLFQEALHLRTARNAPLDQIESTQLAIRMTEKLIPSE